MRPVNEEDVNGDLPQPQPTAAPSGARPDLIVVQATASGFDSALNRLCNSNPTDSSGKPRPDFRVSAHYLIGKTGWIVKLVEEDQEAWHAGNSCWEGFASLDRSLNV